MANASQARSLPALSRVNGRSRRSTATSSFGVSRRESHDASEFYGRFPVPTLDEGNDDVRPATVVDRIWHGDARQMDEVGDVADASVALVVTSPPYYAGKEYETAIGQGHVPDSYRAYLEMLRDVFAECARKLEPGGRTAVNVANLGRKPYRSLSADVIHILERLGLLLRGEIIWQKARGAGGNCAWGSFQRPGNPVLRDLTERIVVASKGRFDRAVKPKNRAASGMPSVTTIAADEFMDLTTDVWEFPPESATRVGHPAPFPVELPRRLMDLYTYKGDLVLDPFMGSGSTAVAAVRTGRHFVGFDTDADYVNQATMRVRAEIESLPSSTSPVEMAVSIPAVRAGDDKDDLDFQRRAVREGRKAKDLARETLQRVQYEAIVEDVKVAPGVEVSFRARDKHGGVWHFEVAGAFSSSRPGLKRMDALWKALGKASVVRGAQPRVPLILLTTDVPLPNSAGARALAEVCGDGEHKVVRDVIRLRDPGDLHRLQRYAQR